MEGQASKNARCGIISVLLTEQFIQHSNLQQLEREERLKSRKTENRNAKNGKVNSGGSDSYVSIFQINPNPNLNLFFNSLLYFSFVSEKER